MQPAISKAGPCRRGPFSCEWICDEIRDSVIRDSASPIQPAVESQVMRVTVAGGVEEPENRRGPSTIGATRCREQVIMVGGKTGSRRACCLTGSSLLVHFRVGREVGR